MPAPDAPTDTACRSNVHAGCYKAYCPCCEYGRAQERERSGELDRRIAALTEVFNAASDWIDAADDRAVELDDALFDAVRDYREKHEVGFTAPWLGRADDPCVSCGHLASTHDVEERELGEDFIHVSTSCLAPGCKCDGYLRPDDV